MLSFIRIHRVVFVDVISSSSRKPWLPSFRKCSDKYCCMQLIFLLIFLHSEDGLFPEFFLKIEIDKILINARKPMINLICSIGNRLLEGSHLFDIETYLSVFCWTFSFTNSKYKFLLITLPNSLNDGWYLITRETP